MTQFCGSPTALRVYREDKTIEDLVSSLNFIFSVLMLSCSKPSRA
jgi:hypothetical protein